MKPLLLVALLVFAAGTALAETVILDGFTLIDGTGSKPLEHAAMIIADGRI